MSTVAVTRETDPTPSEEDIAHWVLGPTLIAVLVELVLLRLVTRTAIHIPGIDAFAGPYRAVASLGRFAFYAASVLLAVTLVLLARLLVRLEMRAEAAACGSVVVAAAAARLELISPPLLAVVLGVATVVLTVRVVRNRPRLGPAMVLFAAALLAAGTHHVVQDLAGTNRVGSGSTIALLYVAEVLVVVALCLLPRGVSHDRRDLVIGIAAGLVTAGVFVASAATTRILMLWTFGLAGYLPALVYAAAVGILAMVISGMWRRDRTPAVGLVFLFAGGLGLHNSYQSALVVCGLALLALPDRPAR